MDAHLDSVDNVPQVMTDKVEPLEQSERDKQRQFSRALKEKMEEDLEKRRKKQREDKLVIAQLDRQAADHQDENQNPTEPEPAPEDRDQESERDDRDGTVDENHVDLKA